MKYSFRAYGHPNIRGTHRTTLEFTKDREVSPEGDCIIGVNADFDAVKIKEFISNSKSRKIRIMLETDSGILDEVEAELNPGFGSSHEIVIRKTDFRSERTLAINANKASFQIDRTLIEHMKISGTKLRIIIQELLG